MTFEVTGLETVGSVRGRVTMTSIDQYSEGKLWFDVPVAKLTEYKFGQQFELIYAGVPSMAQEE